MQFTCFHLMPYRPMDMAERRKYRAAWVVLPNDLYDPELGAQHYESYIDQLVYSEELGFDVIGVNEHHQTAYGMMPAPNLIASALIQRTKKIKIAVIGRALPLTNNPLYIAEEFAMLDTMSRGRIIAGFVRGIGTEYHATGINPAFSHGRFREAHDIIVQAWTKPGPFSFEGEHYNLRYVNLWPKTFQRPHPPIWIPSQGSIETVEWASAPERKYPFLVTFSSHDLVKRYLTSYREAARKHGYEASGDQLGWALPVYVGDTDEKAKEEAGHAVETLFNDFLASPWEMLVPPGYSSIASMKNLIKNRGQLGITKRLTADELIANGTAVIGSPKFVREQIQKMRDATGLENLVPMLQFGVLDDAKTKRNMERFAAEIMPHFR